MPVYLCQPGVGHPDPWRHGIQVYAAPFPIEPAAATLQQSSGGRDLVIAHGVYASANNASAGDSSTVSLPSTAQSIGFPIRRIRHAEIVLVDDVCIAFDRYWLRLRWPGASKQGVLFAGYIAMGLVAESEHPRDLFLSGKTATLNLGESSQEETDGDDIIREEEPQENASMLSAEPFDNDHDVQCARTGLTFQSSNVLRLLALYDDGITPRVSLAPFPTESVFCRICREGLHDDANEDQPTGGVAEDETGGNINDGHLRENTQSLNNFSPIERTMNHAVSHTSKGPVQPHPPYSPNPHALENPMLAPCECAGSMAFVHYLCVEQWRCRSRHPDAHNGLHCETCSKPYALPPPAARPQAPTMDQDDWIDAMPPHVIQALRQPHILWQIGSAAVRRRWLRPIVPVISSPLVSLYCRARRLLKKRGVARRRWACSLCRRRARWKCVRCLRSYYCSRQCQNVSWHIVHKHVCYKPARFWWSVVVYGAAALFFFPEILKDPLMYDMGLLLAPFSFVVMTFLAGGLALLVKKGARVDLRGRALELAVCVASLWLTWISWGLVMGFFGNPDICRGFLGSYTVDRESLTGTSVFQNLVRFVFRPAKTYYLLWDNLAQQSGRLSRWMCTGGEGECFKYLPKANAEFFLEDQGGGKCASDILTVLSVYSAAGIFYLAGNYAKHRERLLRRVGRRPVVDNAHLHQD